MRVVFSYYGYAKTINSHLNVICSVTDTCNGYFLDYFEPVDGITFYNKQPNDNKIDYYGCSIIKDHKPNYEKLKLRSFIKEKLGNKIKLLGNNYISVHIRRTDHISLAKKNKRFITDEEFKYFIDKFSNKNIFIATDNITTYNKFKKLYNERIKLNFDNSFPNKLRKTTLENAILDLFVCVNSTEFMGSGWSSFSDLICELRNLKKY